MSQIFRQAFTCHYVTIVLVSFPQGLANHCILNIMSDTSGEQHTLKNMCIIHVDGLETYSTLKLLSDNHNPEGRLRKLNDVGVRRMAQPANFVLRMEQSCARLPHQLRPEQGYHRECYQRFTMNLHRLHDVGDNQLSTSKLCH